VDALPAPQSHRLLAASGWLELGCAQEALAELEQLSGADRRHPDVLELEWLIRAELKQWEAALSLASRLVELAPERASGWLHRAYAMRRVPEGGVQRARELLLAAVEKFPEESVIPYNLACYACVLGDLDEARAWFGRACRAGRKDALKSMALKDDDLKPLWDEIRLW